MSDIPKMQAITITKAAINGQVVDVVEYDEYTKNKRIYEGRIDVAIPVTDSRGKDILLPVKGNYPSSNTTLLSPGVYNAGPVDFFVEPEEAFTDRYVSKNPITMSNGDDIRDLIIAGEKSKKLDEPFITSPDNITNIPIKENDQPEMVALKMALNSKKIDIDKYAPRFGSNFPNDKRQLKGDSATLNIIKRYCNNMDMEALLTLRDKDPDVPNPMGMEITISLTKPIQEFFDSLPDSSFTNNLQDDEDDSEEFGDD